MTRRDLAELLVAGLLLGLWGGWLVWCWWTPR